MSTKLFHHYRAIVLGALILTWIGGLGGCSTTEVEPKPVPTIAPPEYVSVPHPTGYNLGDLRAVFHSSKAPELATLKDCDAPFAKLRGLTNSEEEIRAGARELVKQDPVLYHWCFYGKLIELEDFLKQEPYVDQRQKNVLKAYGFLVPIARGFATEFHDSRYLRWAIRHYKSLSEWVFFRKLDISPQMTQELAEAANPFGLVRENAAQKPILEKYGIVKSSSPAAFPSPSTATAAVAPAAATPSADATPVAAPSAEAPATYGSAVIPVISPAPGGAASATEPGSSSQSGAPAQSQAQPQSPRLPASAPEAPTGAAKSAASDTFSATDGPNAEPVQ